jgi:hypothetical protein
MTRLVFKILKGDGSKVTLENFKLRTLFMPKSEACTLVLIGENFLSRC